MIKLLTIVIPSYKSKNLVLKHIKKLPKNIKIIIVENSLDTNLKNYIEKNYKNIDIYLKKNIGYGRAINFASNLIRTKYFFVINPDTKIYKNTLRNLLRSAETLSKFGMLCPEHIDNKYKNKKKILIEKKLLNGAAMLFKTKIFKKIRGFDKNIFLYYEENDYFKKCNNLNLKLYIVSNSYHFHSLKGDTSSATFKDSDQHFYAHLISGWHGQWSKFYYFRKYNGYLTSFIKCLPNFLSFLSKVFINLVINPKKAKYNYFKIEGLLCSMLGLPSFKRSKYDKF